MSDVHIFCKFQAEPDFLVNLDFLVKYTPHVERLGFDENFLDVSELVTDRLSKYGGEPVQGFVYGSDEAVGKSSGKQKMQESW